MVIKHMDGSIHVLSDGDWFFLHGVSRVHELIDGGIVLNGEVGLNDPLFLDAEDGI